MRTSGLTHLSIDHRRNKAFLPLTQTSRGDAKPEEKEKLSERRRIACLTQISHISVPAAALYISPNSECEIVRVDDEWIATQASRAAARKGGAK